MIDGLHRLSFEAMGCRFELMLDPEGPGLDQWSVRAVGEEIRELVFDWHTRLSIFDPASDISRINRSPVGTPLPLDGELYELLALCERLREQTNGAFHNAAGTLMRVHGFRECDAFTQSTIPFDLDCAFELSETDMTITRTHELASLDFGAVAKGYVLDLVRELLTDHGIQNAFVHGGTSSILALGVDKAGNPWPAIVCEGTAVNTAGYSMGISEGASQEIELDGNMIGHVMDTRTNSPACSSIERVICVHRSATFADAFSTACLARPELIDELSAKLNDDPCTIIAVDSDTEIPFIHDPLGVVVQRSEDM